ncbi:ABC transporter permease [Prosthecochloris sp. HL-130-GSB]|uniref:ABC transporter permease n=1 Tax=Prosthecochloris sp. HL-130-GSB TaxID=1974213 RepID=UPI000A1C0AB0|nr:ABC transporter permease [Prosthecochloris sp. HL-130-GSB]ARM30937.1 hypothetical protein B9H02_06005 [Prosthecochloris sp. HL-130-GSB]MBO8092679.1 ABC transporter permease [Prosthecochloris sp.]
MKAELYIARRFALKQRSATRPTFIIMIAVVGIAVGTAALILTLSIVKGFASTIETRIISFNSHMQVRHAEGGLFYPLDADTERLEGIREVTSVTPFLEKHVMLKSPQGIQPAMMKGVGGPGVPSFLQGSIVSGSWAAPSSGSTLQVMVGSSLAESLGIDTGSRLMIISTSNQLTGNLIGESDSVVDMLGEMQIELATVQGIYETGLHEGFDDFMVIAPLDQLQRYFAPARISGYELMVDDLSSLDSTTRAAADVLGYPFYSYTVYERYANLFEWLKLQKNITPLLIITITVVAVFNIISTLLVLIIEKTREIGMLMALGCTRESLSRIFLSQAVFIALIGITAGNLAALGLSLFELHFQLITLPEKNYFIKHVPLLIDPLDYVLVSAAVGGLTLLFAFLPARIAAGLKPGEALLT